MRLDIPNCDGASGAEIARLVALELAPQQTVTTDPSSAAPSASLRCSDERAVITVQDAPDAAPLMLELSFAETRVEARPRMLALAVAELIATSRLEHTPGRPITTPVAPVARRATLLWLGAGVVRAFEPTQWLPALAVGAAHSFGPIALAGDVGYEWTGRELETARVTANDVSLGLALQLHILQGVLAWRVGPGVRVGYAWLAAAARTDALHGGKLSGWFMAPMLQSMLELRLTARWSLQLALELGYIAKPLRGLDADSAALLQLRGLRMSGQLGVGFAL